MFNSQSFKKGNRIFPIKTNGLISYWKMDEASGTRFDQISGNNLTDNASVGQVPGKQYQAASFTTASSQYLSIASNASLQTGNIDYTLIFWVNLKDKSSTYALVTKYDTGLAGQNEFYTDYASSNDRFRFIVTSDGTAQVALSANNFGSPTVGIWYLVIASHDASAATMSISINAGTPNTASISSAFAGTAAFEIGRAGSTLQRYANANIDEVSLWKRLLTSSEQLAIYNNGIGRTYLP